MSDAVVREVVETLGRLERGAGSRGETEAADWLARRLSAAGAPARIDAVRYLDGYARMILPLGLAGMAAGAVAASTGRGRKLTAAITAFAGLAIADDIDNRWRVWRRLTAKRRATTNVIADAGDAGADRTLVVLAHHDAAPTGVVFDQSLQREIARRFPDVVANTHTSLPLWWPVLAPPLIVFLGAVTGRRGLLGAGTALGALVNALGADIARHRIVPGANDNLSACAALVGVAERLRERPVEGIRVLLVSCGAEEVLQGGIYDFVERHLRQLDPAKTWVLNLDTVGSPQLVMVEGEGVLLKVEDYTDPSFRDLVADTAKDAGISLVRGQRARASTDSVIPSRAGYPTTTLISFEPDTKLLSNYHLPTDTPENLDYGTVVEAVDLTEALVRRLAG